jgi:FkbM family methyltransferase
VWRFKSYDEPPHGIVVDLGANIGGYSIFSAKSADRVLAFEPLQIHYDLLLKNIELNFCKNIDTFKYAIGKSRGKRLIYIADTNIGSSSFFRPTPNSVEVQTITISDIFVNSQLDRINMLKVDIEGAEHEVFKDIDVELLRKIDKIIMEVHNYGTKQEDVKAIISKLEQADFNVTVSRWLFFLAGFGVIRAVRG